MLIITQIQHPLRKTADNKKQDSGTGRKKQQNERRKSTKEEFFKLPRDFFK